MTIAFVEWVNFDYWIGRVHLRICQRLCLNRPVGCGFAAPPYFPYRSVQFFEGSVTMTFSCCGGPEIDSKIWLGRFFLSCCILLFKSDEMNSRCGHNWSERLKNSWVSWYSSCSNGTLDHITRRNTPGAISSLSISIILAFISLPLGLGFQFHSACNTFYLRWRRSSNYPSAHASIRWTRRGVFHELPLWGCNRLMDL